MDLKIQKQVHFFEENKDELLKKYRHKFIVVSPTLQVTPFETLSAGFNFGIKEYGYGNFLLNDCTVPHSQVHIISPSIVKA